MDDAATTKYPAAANETNVKRINWLRLLLLVEVVCSSSGGGGGGLRIEDGVVVVMVDADWWRCWMLLEKSIVDDAYNTNVVNS